MKFALYLKFVDGDRKRTERNVFTYKTIEQAEQAGKRIVDYHNGNKKVGPCKGYIVMIENNKISQYVKQYTQE